MKINEKLLFSCLAGYTTETGKQEAEVTCTREGWSPEPCCYSECVGYVHKVFIIFKEISS